MYFKNLFLLSCFIFLFLGGTNVSYGDVWISEFMASNDSGLEDSDGDSSDWIEIYNDADTPVNLGGWRLTDDASEPAQWIFPSTVLSAKGFIVVFASGKNRRSVGGELHTNFKLSKSGEYLALSKPDGSVEHAYAPRIGVEKFA